MKRLLPLCAVLLAGLAFSPVVAQAAPAPGPGDTAAQPLPASGRLIVGYRTAKSDSAVASDAKDKGARVQRRLSTGGVLIDAGSPAQAATLRTAYQKDPAVAYVDVDGVAWPQADPNDTDYAKQWDLFEATAGMNVPGAWATTTGSGVTVAVIDTGYAAHSDLAANIVSGYDFITDSSYAGDSDGRDNNPADQGDAATRGFCGNDASGNPVPASDTTSSWHGTHVAGTIGAVANNSKGVAGVAYNAKIQPVRVLGKCGGSVSDIADAITWASGGSVSGVPANSTPAKVLNLSLGGKQSCPTTYQNAINAAVGRGATVVVAAGNSNDNVANYTPANCSNVLVVAASSRSGARAFYSNYGTGIDITAPGGEVRRSTDPSGSVTTPDDGIYSTVNAGSTTPTSESYKPMMGTSMAAPHVAGLAALLLSTKSTLTPAQVESTIKSTARTLPGTCSGGCGSGLADSTAAVQSLSGSTPAPTGCSGYQSTYTATLSTVGSSKQEPNGTYYQSNVSGTHRACLQGPSGSDFDLYLYKWNGSSWAVVASDTGAGTSKTISYAGAAGYYTYLVSAAAGTGGYSLGVTKP